MKKGARVASTVQTSPNLVGIEGAESNLPWGLIREELQVLAPAQFTMVDYLLSDLVDRAPTLSEREQVHELMIVILCGLAPRFPPSRTFKLLDS
jgi:hypothetical protein